jgi:hypothetical protein
MKLVGCLTVGLAMLAAGCTSTYTQRNLTSPAAKLLKGGAVVIATPDNGSYGGREYAGSGKAAALAVRAAFAKFTNSTTVTTEAKDLDSLKGLGSAHYDYYVIPEILHWEDRATEWSGLPDRIEVKLSVYEATTWKELAAATITGKSKWATFGGDHPQDLLQEPIDKYVASLY